MNDGGGFVVIIHVFYCGCSDENPLLQPCGALWRYNARCVRRTAASTASDEAGPSKVLATRYPRYKCTRVYRNMRCVGKKLYHSANDKASTNMPPCVLASLTYS